MDKQAGQMVVKQEPVAPGEILLGIRTNYTEPEKCRKIQTDYTIVPIVICSMCFIFGIVYTFFGYRFFKAVMFMTGFIFGGLLVYLVCIEENLLPFAGKIGVAVGAGVLCGLITMLVQYVGLFLNGFHFGVFLAVASLVIMEQFHHPSTKWIPIGLICGLGAFFAVANLYFQKGLTILGTCVFGSGLMVMALDYFIENFMMVYYIWERIKAVKSDRVCWFSWLILGLWPLASIIGAVAQWRVTGHGYDHKEVVHRKRQRKVNLHRLRNQESPGHSAAPTSTPQQRSTAPPIPGTLHSRYRHLYQVRRWNGDVISQVGANNAYQNYIQSMQHRLSPAMRSFVLHDNDPQSSAPLTQVPVRLPPR